MMHSNAQGVEILIDLIVIEALAIDLYMQAPY
jgi:hypothetical protein